MPPQELLDIKDKILWTKSRISQLRFDIGTFFQGHPVVIKEHRCVHRGDMCIEYKFECKRPPANDLRFFVGEIVNNIRSCADNLINLAVKHRHGNVLATLSYFRDQASFDKRAKQWLLHLLPQPLFDWYVSEQSFHRGGALSDIHVVHDLWNGDKHELPVLLYAAISSSGAGNVPGMLLLGPGSLSNESRVIARYLGKLEDVRVLRVFFQIDLGTSRRNSVCDLLDVALHRVDCELVPLVEQTLDGPRV